MDVQTLQILTLANAKALGNRRISNLVRADGVAEVCAHPARFKDALPPQALESLESGAARRAAELQIAAAARAGQTILTLASPEYPASLAALYDPPPALFLKGTLASGRRRVAIVGARGATAWGRSIARDLARGLSDQDVEVVSGLARGIDGAAHEGALAGPATTVAVLGSSVDVIYPKEHKDLASRVAGRGAVVSELPPGTPPAPAQFPLRNRIIVGLCDTVVVVEAGSRSGALITARVALEEGRDVLAVPGRPCDPLSFGPNLLIRDGATLIRGLDDLLSHLGLLQDPCQAPPGTKDPILRNLENSAALSIDQLAVGTGFTPSAVMARLAELELEGRVERLAGTLFRSATPA